MLVGGNRVHAAQASAVCDTPCLSTFISFSTGFYMTGIHNGRAQNRLPVNSLFFPIEIVNNTLLYAGTSWWKVSLKNGQLVKIAVLRLKITFEYTRFIVKSNADQLVGPSLRPVAKECVCCVVMGYVGTVPLPLLEYKICVEFPKSPLLTLQSGRVLVQYPRTFDHRTN